MPKNAIIDNEYNYDFLDHDFWYSYNVNPFWYCLINEQFKCIRKAFNDLDEDSKNVLDYFVIRRLKSPNINIDINRYIEKLRQKYLYYYENWYEYDE